jgi:HrpA-like RNA helicase
MFNVPEIGGVVGYRVGGGGRKVSKATVIEYVTEATLLQDILARGAQALSNVDVVILDEAHERSVTLDILVGRLQMIRNETQRKDLKIIVTSATLDVNLFSKYFGGCPTVEIPGRMFPVRDIYRPPQNSSLRINIVNEVVDCILHVHTNHTLDEGDILAFLPGQREVDEAIANLSSKLFKASASGSGGPLAQILALFGQQEPAEQEPVFKAALANHRKIVIATNVAETSVTIDGVCFVIDSGLEKKVHIFKVYFSQYIE